MLVVTKHAMESSLAGLNKQIALRGGTVNVSTSEASNGRVRVHRGKEYTSFATTLEAYNYIEAMRDGVSLVPKGDK